LGHRYDSIRTVGPCSLNLADVTRTATVKIVSATAIFAGVNGENSFTPASLFDPGHGICGQPIVCMDYIEGANEILGLKDMMDKRPAHIVDFCYEIRIQLKRAAVIMDPVDPIVV
jgi:hypothetical protein